MLDRPDALRLLSEHYPEAPVLLTLGGTVREMLSVAGSRPNHLPILDAMGQPAAIGLGLALAVANSDNIGWVVVVEGDGSLLMGFSSLVTIGHLKPSKLILIVFDNGVYLSTGGQPTGSSETDYVMAARACGWRAARDVTGDIESLADNLAWADEQDGPILLRVETSTSTVLTDYFLEDPVLLARRFRDWLDGKY